MHTLTAKQILTPVADAVSQLIVVSSDAETYNRPLQDLTDVAAVVQSHAKNLVEVGTSMANSSQDTQLKVDMKTACSQVSAAGDLLVESALDLKQDSYNKNGRTKLVEACKGLLQGTTQLLDVYDDSEVRRLIKLCHTCKNNVEKILNIFDMNALIANLRISGSSLVELTSQTSRRSEEVLYPEIQKGLHVAVEKITATTPLLISSCKAVAQNPDKEEAKNLRAVTCKQLIAYFTDIEELVQIREYVPPAAECPGNLKQTRMEVHHQLVEIMSFTKNGDKEQLSAVLETFQFTSGILSSSARQIAKDGGADRTEVHQLCDEIDALTKAIPGVALDAVESQDRDAVRRLFEILTKASDCFDKLETVQDQLNVADLRKNITILKDRGYQSHVITALHEVAIGGKVESIKAVCNLFETSVSVVDSRLAHIGNLSSDQADFQAIRTIQKEIRNLSNQIVTAAKALSFDKNNPAVNDYFSSVMQSWEQKLSYLEELMNTNEHVFPSHQLISAEELLLKAEFLRASQAASANDDLEVKDSLENIGGSINRIIEMIKREQEKSDDPQYKEKLGRIYQDAQRVGAAFAADVKSGINLSTVIQTHQQSIMQLLEQLKIETELCKGTSTRDFKAIIPQIDEPDTIDQHGSLVQNINGEEIEIVMDYAPEPLPEEEAKVNPIKAAAQEIKVAAAQWSSNPLTDVVKALSLKMEHISILYKENTPASRKNLIQTAKDIQEDVKLFTAEANRIADACSDKILTANVLKGVENMTMVSQQLKIVAAVKAAEPKDPDSEKQLILCSQNLMNAVKRTLTSCEVASIRAFRQAANVVLAVAKFRKVLFKPKH